MYRKFIEKFKTEHFSIGSFDYYRKEAEKLIRNNTKMTVEETKEYVDEKLPGSYRAAIVDNNGNFVGYIALYNVKGERGLASIRMETNRELTDAEKEEITGVYKDWLFTALDLNDVEGTAKYLIDEYLFNPEYGGIGLEDRTLDEVVPELIEKWKNDGEHDDIDWESVDEEEFIDENIDTPFETEDDIAEELEDWLYTNYNEE